MPNALMGSLALLDDLGEGLPLRNIDWDWMYLQPLTLLWADAIYCPRRFLLEPPSFDVDVGFERSNEVINRSLGFAWETLVRENVIQPVPIDEEIKEASIFTYHAVRNRLTQTADGGLLLIGMPASADLDPAKPTDQLSLGANNYCINHLDSVAAHLVVSRATDSVWLGSERDDHAVRWLFCGGLDPELAHPRAAKSVFENTEVLRLPKCEFIPPVFNCARCGDNGSVCYTDSYGVEDWIVGAQGRLYQLLQLRDSPEIASLRRLLSDVTKKIVGCADQDQTLAIFAEQELRNSAAIAEKRISKDLDNIQRYCDLAALYSIPMAIIGNQPGASILGDIGYSLAVGSRVVATSAKHLLGERHRWLKLREIDL